MASAAASAGTSCGAGVFYDALGLPRSATQEEIRKAYLRLALLHHPDRGGDAARFRAAAEAHEVLGDPVRRHRYDLLGDAGAGGDEACRSSGPNRGDHFGGFSGGGGGATASSQRRQRTKDAVHDLAVSLEQLYSGATRRVAVSREVLDPEGGAQACSACAGRGVNALLSGVGLCADCGGKGSRPRTRHVQEAFEVVVERGAVNGQRVVFPGRADERPGWDPGDAVFVIREQQHAEFRRHKADLYIDRRLTLLQALAGPAPEVVHLDGRRLRVRSRPGEVCVPPGLCWHPEATWQRFEDTDALAGEDPAGMPSASLEACRRHCSERGFGGFVVRQGWAFFRAASRQELLQRRMPLQGSTLHLSPDSWKLRQWRLRKAVRGEGMPCVGNPLARGNLFVLLTVAFPKTLSPCSVGLLHEALAGAAPSPHGVADAGPEERHLQDVAAEAVQRVTSSESRGAEGGRQQISCRQQ